MMRPRWLWSCCSGSTEASPLLDWLFLCYAGVMAAMDSIASKFREYEYTIKQLVAKLEELATENESLRSGLGAHGVLKLVYCRSWGRDDISRVSVAVNFAFRAVVCKTRTAVSVFQAVTAGLGSCGSSLVDETSPAATYDSTSS